MKLKAATNFLDSILTEIYLFYDRDSLGLYITNLLHFPNTKSSFVGNQILYS